MLKTKNQKFFKFFKFLFFILIAYLPFQVAINPMPGIDLASGRVIAAILIGYWLYYFFNDRQKNDTFEKKGWWRQDLVGLFLVLLMLWSVFSLLWAIDFEIAFRRAILWLNFMPLYFVSQMFLKTKNDLKTLFKVLAYSGAGVILIALVQFGMQFIVGTNHAIYRWFILYPSLFGKLSATSAVLSPPNWMVNISGTTFMRAISTLPGPNMLGFYLAFIVPTLFLVREKYFKVIGIFGIIVLLFTFSRGAYLGAIVAGILWAIFLFKYRTKFFFPKKLCLTAPVSARSSGSPHLPLGKKFFQKPSFFGKNSKSVIILFIVICSLFIAFSPVRERLVSSFDFNDSGVQERVNIWKQATNVIKNNPMLGVGIGNFGQSVDLFSKARGMRSPIHAHNIYLQIMSELGIIGLILYLGVIILALKNLYYLCIQSSTKIIPSNEKGWYLGILLSLLWFSVHGLFDVPLFSPRILPFLIIFLALTSYKKYA